MGGERALSSKDRSGRTIIARESFLAHVFEPCVHGIGLRKRAAQIGGSKRCSQFVLGAKQPSPAKGMGLTGA